MVAFWSRFGHKHCQNANQTHSVIRPLIMEKTKALIFSTRPLLSSLKQSKPIKMGGLDIGFVQHHLYLGVMIDSIMSLVPLLKDIKKKVTHKIFV